MSTEITPESIRHTLLVTSFWGGHERGTCIQLTPAECHDVGYDYSQLTQREVFDLVDCLLRWSAEQQNRKLSGTTAGTTTKGLK